MAHDHGHHHGDHAREYFTEQLLTIFVVGLFGFVAVRLYQTGMLEYVLAPQFRLPVLIGGVGVLVLVAVRAVAVWREAGEVRGHSHDHGHDHHHGHAHDHADHVHGPDCDHSHDNGHAHHDHGHHHHHAHDHTHDDHGHSHDLAWVFTRMLVLFFPVALFLIGVPNSGFSQDHLNKLLGNETPIGVELGAVRSGAGEVMSFNDLREAAYDASKREYFEGKVGIIEGLFRPVAQNQFTLYKLKMTCCAADTVPLKIRIVTPTALGGVNDGDWVQVKGEVRFVPIEGSSQYLPVIAVADISDVKNLTRLGLDKSRNKYE